MLTTGYILREINKKSWWAKTASSTPDLCAQKAEANLKRCEAILLDLLSEPMTIAEIVDHVPQYHDKYIRSTLKSLHERELLDKKTQYQKKLNARYYIYWRL